MLVSLAHMQVSVCMFEGRGGSNSGISRFRKNNICFPQKVSELQQHQAFISQLQINDIVNVPGKKHTLPKSNIDNVRARVMQIQDNGILVRVHGEAGNRVVDRKDVNARVTLPWKPQDLSHALIVLRRRNRWTDEYIEDL